MDEDEIDGAESAAHGTARLRPRAQTSTTDGAADAHPLETGRIRMSGPSAELLASDEIRKAYLGV